ncbi:TPA: hypothetical protein ACVHUD_002679 [Legionella anisa]
MKNLRLLLFYVAFCPVIAHADLLESMKTYLHKHNITSCDHYLTKYFTSPVMRVISYHEMTTTHGPYAIVNFDIFIDRKDVQFSTHKSFMVSQFENICSFEFFSSSVWDMGCNSVLKLPFNETEKKTYGWKKMKNFDVSRQKAFYGKEEDGTDYRRFYKDVWTKDGDICLEETHGVFSGKAR